MKDKRKHYEPGDTGVMEILLTDKFGLQGCITLSFDTSAWGGIAEALKRNGIEKVAELVANLVHEGVKSQLPSVLEEK